MVNLSRLEEIKDLRTVWPHEALDFTPWLAQEDMMDLQLGDVQETALLPIAIRANETKRKNARVHDEKAVEIIEILAVDTKRMDKFFSHEGVVARMIIFAEGLLMYFSKEQVRVILNNITCTFGRGFLLAELMHPKMMNEKMHDTVKHTNAKFGWGTKTGKELSEFNLKLKLIKESSFWDEMKKYTLVGKLGSVLAKGLNNRLAVYRWGK